MPAIQAVCISGASSLPKPLTEGERGLTSKPSPPIPIEPYGSPPVSNARTNPFRPSCGARPLGLRNEPQLAYPGSKHEAILPNEPESPNDEQTKNASPDFSKRTGSATPKSSVEREFAKRTGDRPTPNDRLVYPTTNVTFPDYCLLFLPFYLQHTRHSVHTLSTRRVDSWAKGGP